HLQLQSHLLDYAEHGFFVWRPGGDDGFTHPKWSDATLTQCFDKLLICRFAQQAALLLLRPVEKRAVLEHGNVEEVEAVEYLLQVVQFTTGHQEQLAAGSAQDLECGDGLSRGCAVCGQGAVVVASQCQEAHMLRD